MAEEHPIPLQIEPEGEEQTPYTKALTTLKAYWDDLELDSQETRHLKSAAETPTEYAIIAEYHQEQADKMLKEFDDERFQYHASLATLARIADKKIKDNTLADGELSRLTDDLLSKIDSDSIDSSQQRSNNPFLESPFLNRDYPLLDRLFPENVPSPSDKNFNPPLEEEKPQIDYEKLREEGILLALKSLPKMSESERNLTENLVELGKNQLEVPKTHIDPTKGHKPSLA